MYVPGVLYVYTGFSTMLVLPSPKFQLHEDGKFLLLSVNCTVSGAAPFDTLAVKFAVGACELTVRLTRS